LAARTAFLLSVSSAAGGTGSSFGHLGTERRKASQLWGYRCGGDHVRISAADSSWMKHCPRRELGWPLLRVSQDTAAVWVDPAIEWTVEHYANGDEDNRLQSGSGLLEFARTVEILQRYLPPPPARIADVGAGLGTTASG
jgi:hypothetical protein